MTYRFYLHRQKPDKTKRIEIRFSLHGKRFWIKTDRYTYPDLWTQSLQKSKDYATRQFIKTVQDLISDMERRCYLSGIELTQDYIRNAFRDFLHKPKEVVDITRNDYSLLDAFDIYQVKYEDQKTFNYLRKFKSAKKHIQGFNPKIIWADINNGFLDQYVHYCISHETKPLQNPSINKYLSSLREVCRMAIDDGITVSRAYETFKVTEHKAKPIWLTKDEAGRLFSVEVVSKQEQIVLDDSAIRYYLGLRNSDIDQLKPHHFQEINGQMYVQISIMKTGSSLTLPVPDPARVILERHGYQLPYISLQQKNLIIKTLNKRAKIDKPVEIVRFSGSKRIRKVIPKWKAISTHTFRRSFGRRFMESVGDINKLREILGHIDARTTEGYIGWESVEIADAMKKVVY